MRLRLKSPASRFLAQPFVQARSRKHQSSELTGLREGNPPVDSPHKGSVTTHWHWYLQDTLQRLLCVIFQHKLYTCTRLEIEIFYELRTIEGSSCKQGDLVLCVDCQCEKDGWIIIHSEFTVMIRDRPYDCHSRGQIERYTHCTLFKSQELRWESGISSSIILVPVFQMRPNVLKRGETVSILYRELDLRTSAFIENARFRLSNLFNVCLLYTQRLFCMSY